MKKILFCCITLLSIGVFAQTTKPVAKKINQLTSQHVNFKKFNVLNETSQKNTTVENTVSSATLAKIDLSSIQSIYNQKNNTLEISIPYQGQSIEVQLYRVNPFTDSFTLKTNKKEFVDYIPGVYYRGIVKNDPNSLASFSFFGDKFSGIISANEYQNLNIGKLQRENNTTDYVVYSDKNLNVTNNFNCETDDFVKDAYSDYPSSMFFEGAVVTEKCVTMYYEMDYGLFTANGSDIDETMDWMSATYNNMQTLYENDDITIALNEVFIWETLDPYQGSGGSGDYLAAFNNERPNFGGDVGQLIGSNDNSGGGIAAAIDGLCSENNYSYAGVDIGFNTVPTYSWTIMVMTHEHGHVLGSRHTHACVWNGNNTAIDGCAGFVEGSCSLPGNPPEGGTIMSYCHFSTGINFNLGFGDQPKTVIINNINSQECLSTDCISVCFNTVHDISLTNVTETEATLSWEDTDENADIWEYAVRETGSSAALNWTQSSDNSVELDGLEANTYYNAYVRKLCDAITTSASEQMFATDADFCNGILFTDSGGNSGDYSDNEDITRTIVPVDSDEKVKVIFTMFNVEQGYDFLHIHNGMDTTATDLTGNGLTGSVSSGTSFQSTDESGALSFRFTSDIFVTESGWIAEIECLGELGTDDVSSYLDFSYYPNPVINQLNINAKNEILGATVYTIEGKKLNKTTIKSTGAQLDFSKYPAGTYVVELKFKEKPVSIKVIKK